MTQVTRAQSAVLKGHGIKFGCFQWFDVIYCMQQLLGHSDDQPVLPGEKRTKLSSGPLHNNIQWLLSLFLHK